MRGRQAQSEQKETAAGPVKRSASVATAQFGWSVAGPQIVAGNGSRNQQKRKIRGCSASLKKKKETKKKENKSTRVVDQLRCPPRAKPNESHETAPNQRGPPMTGRTQEFSVDLSQSRGPRSNAHVNLGLPARLQRSSHVSMHIDHVGKVFVTTMLQVTGPVPPPCAPAPCPGRHRLRGIDCHTTGYRIRPQICRNPGIGSRRI